MNVTKQEIIKQAKLELARREFFFYCHLRADKFYKENRQYLVDLCNDLQKFIEGDDEVLILNLPPRHGKSRTVEFYKEEGKTFKNWLGDSEEVLNKSGLLNNLYYLEIVYRNNMNSAYNAGAFHNQELNKENKPYGLYDAVGDNRISSICKSFK